MSGKEVDWVTCLSFPAQAFRGSKIGQSTRFSNLAPPAAFVLRNGQPKEVETAFLVPGDLLLLKVGQRVPADARLLEAYGLEADESSLTGESFPAAKDITAVLPNETRIADQTNMVFTGTVITRGRAKAVITPPKNPKLHFSSQ